MPRLIETSRLSLRPLTLEDAPYLRALWAERDPRALHRISEDGHPTVEEMRERLRAELSESEATGIWLYGVELTGGGVVGCCGLIAGRASEAEPELAFELFRRFHGSGYATEAARAVVRAADASGRQRLWSTVREWNSPSLRVFAKLGFEPTGRSDPDDQRGALLWFTRSRLNDDEVNR